MRANVAASLIRIGDSTCLKISPQRAEAHYSQPFVPFQGNPGGPDSPATARIATAAEYAAAQLGVIARKVEQMELHLARIAAHYPQPGSAQDIMN